MNELSTKQEYQEALEEITILIDKAVDDLNKSKSMKRMAMSECINLIIRNDLKSKDAQEAYIIESKPKYRVIFDCYDNHQERLNKLLRQREDILKLMSFSQSEMRLI